ncbi:hypothetical protein A9320_01415 [Ruegeria sp. PBVC088]|nr:hypothetical protein A9320_01415 [Ruegeria sp. PBVC088]
MKGKRLLFDLRHLPALLQAQLKMSATSPVWPRGSFTQFQMKKFQPAVRSLRLRRTVIIA